MALIYFKRFRMEYPLTRPLFDVRPLPPQYSLVAWDETLLEAHAETKLRCFETEIDAHVFPSLGHLDGCLRLMREITGREGFLPEATWLLRFDGDAAPVYVGTIQGIGKSQGVGAIQNVGVVPAHRGQGLGTILMHRAMQGFADAGLKRTSLEVTARNRRALHLYRRLGFRKVRTVYKTADVAYA